MIRWSRPPPPRSAPVPDGGTPTPSETVNETDRFVETIHRPIHNVAAWRAGNAIVVFGLLCMEGGLRGTPPAGLNAGAASLFYRSHRRAVRYRPGVARGKA